MKAAEEHGVLLAELQEHLGAEGKPGAVVLLERTGCSQKAWAFQFSGLKRFRFARGMERRSGRLGGCGPGLAEVIYMDLRM